MARFHDGIQRVATLFAEKGSAAELAERNEARAERLRLLYVGLTRARLATWLVWGDVNHAGNTPLAWLLHRQPGAEAVDAIVDASIPQRLSLLQQQAPAAIAIIDASTSPALPRLRFSSDDTLAPAAAVAMRSLSRDWWVYSFSQLSREDDGREQGGAGDEIESTSLPAPSRFSGARFGNSLHAALERTRFEAWRDGREDAPPPGEEAALIEALRGEAYVGDNDLAEGVPLLARLIRHTLTVRLPEGVRLADLPAPARRSEMEFHFALRSTPLDALLTLLHRHGLLREREKFGQRTRIEGLMTGKIDLVYEHAGLFYLLDYKSNQLPDYGAAALDAAMHDSEYTLQYLIYTLALHRWLGFRLGAAYDYDRHFGGVRYLFCRGLDATREDSPGIYATRPSRSLIEALDELLAPATAEVSA
jgi:exodeoxyribonuclease V beta subunit